ncbi:MAG: type II secretion system protein [Candidatus Hydrogenedentes bacterium]|nr:type II secretion system protein [Candidatus Hydrogenedentota bacterium]
MHSCPRHNPARARGSEAGFTLIEIMIALAILGSSLFILLEMHYNAVNAQDRLNGEISVRNLLSQAVGIAEVEIAMGTLKDAQDFGDRFPGWRYTFDAEQVDATSSTTSSTAVSAYPGLHDVLVTVEGPEGAVHELHFYTVVRMTPDGEVAGEEAAEGGEQPEALSPEAGAQ